jgi:hypothetical protein
MPYLLGGLAIFLGLISLVYLFIKSDPRKLARDLEWAVAVLGAVGLVGIILSERYGLIWLPLLLMLFPFRRRLRPMLARLGPPKGPVTTPYLRATQDLESGLVTGAVLRGVFAGSQLSELARDELVMLLTECRDEDPAAARLVEAYLDQKHPGWLDDLAEAGNQGTATASRADMSIGEARAILGVDPGADDSAINDAHRRLLGRLHGGSDYLAGKINRARDVLLGQR